LKNLVLLKIYLVRSYDLLQEALEFFFNTDSHHA
jgi:hypothetical protein